MATPDITRARAVLRSWCACALDLSLHSWEEHVLVHFSKAEWLQEEGSEVRCEGAAPSSKEEIWVSGVCGTREYLMEMPLLERD